MKRLVLAAGVAVVCLAGTPTSSPVGAGPTAGSVVAVLANPDFVDMSPIDEGGEVQNLVADLQAGGHTVRPFTDVSAAGIEAALEGVDALAIPELEADRFLYDDLAQDAIAVMRDFVDGGGRLLLFWAFDASAGLHDVFGISAGTLDGCDPRGDAPCVRTEAAADTEFADGPATLGGVNASVAVLTQSLPPGSTAIYHGEEDVADEEEPRPSAIVDVASVAAVPFGDGAIIVFGWDWFPDAENPDDLAPEAAGPASADDEADWATVLDLAASQPEVTASVDGADRLVLTSSSPVVQPVFVAVTVAGRTHTVEIPAGSTTATATIEPAATVAFTVPGWGVGGATVAVAPPPAQPVPAAPLFTG